MKSSVIKMGALALILLFFMPFFLVSCGSQMISISGSDMAFGNSNYGMDGSFMMLLLFLLPICIAIISFSKQYNKLQSITKYQDIAAIISSVISLLLLYWAYSQISEEVLRYSAKLEIKIGFIFTVITNIAIISVIIYDKLQQNSMVTTSSLKVISEKIISTLLNNPNIQRLILKDNQGNVESEIDRSIVFCKNCGNKIRENENFCSQCGTKVEWKKSNTNIPHE